VAVVAPTFPRARASWVFLPLLAAFLAVGGVAVYRYLDNFWLYRGFAAPRDPAWVTNRGTTTRFYVASPALGGRRQPVDVFLPPGYSAHPLRRYGVMYLLHGIPGRPGAFLQTVRMGVVEDELVALRRARPLILVMPFGSTGSFTDKEWANGVGKHEGWATFVSRDVVAAVDARFRTIRSPRWRVLAGLSEGGYGALNIGLRHPREFAVLESWSGYAQADPIKTIFGKHGELLRANSPIDTVGRVARVLRREHTFVWFYSGEDDHYRPQNVAFAAELKADGIAHHFYVVRGGHNWALWRGNAWRAYMTASRHVGIARGHA
jgi:enterochelin esterase-like enzyme